MEPEKHVHPYVDVLRCTYEKCDPEEKCIRMDNMYCPLDAVHLHSTHPAPVKHNTAQDTVSPPSMSAA